jgi:Zn-dependent protease
MGNYELSALLIFAVPLLLSLTVHEFAHARTALAFGDPTAKLMGRCTLNPLAHLDPIGTIVLVLTQFIGWAKPVPVNPANLTPRRWGDIAVSLAGPISNLTLALLVGLSLRTIYTLGIELPDVVMKLLIVTVLANIGLCVFNLIPLFPLDGHHVVRELLPRRMQDGYMRAQRSYGQMSLLGIVFIPRLLSMGGGPNVSPIRWLYNGALNLLAPVLFG